MAQGDCKTAEKQTLRIACSGADRLPIDAIEDFQGGLKKRGKREIDQIITSLLRFGFSFPFFVWNGSGHNYCLDGHGRIMALCELRKRGYNLPLFPVAYIEADDEAEAKQKLLRLNSQYGAMTIDTVMEFMGNLEINGDELALPKGFLTLGDSAEVSTEDAEPQITRAEELAATWGVETGQVWKLGEHRIMCGDSANGNDIQKLLQGDRAICIFTDPPYGVSIGAKNRMLNSFSKAERNVTDIKDDDISPEELKVKLLPAFKNFKQYVMSDDCTVFVTAPQGGELGMMMMMMQEACPRPRHVLIWKKNTPTFSMGRLDYDYQHEPILMTWGKKHKRPMGGTHKTSVWEIDKPRSCADHPTMKPVELYENAYLNNSDKGDIVFDGYSGSGTAIIAAEHTGRVCRSMEIAPGYVAIAIQRWADATGGTPELIEEPPCV
jgi:DNA modification methylase